MRAARTCPPFLGQTALVAGRAPKLTERDPNCIDDDGDGRDDVWELRPDGVKGFWGTVYQQSGG